MASPVGIEDVGHWPSSTWYGPRAAGMRTGEKVLRQGGLSPYGWCTSVREASTKMGKLISQITNNWCTVTFPVWFCNQMLILCGKNRKKFHNVQNIYAGKDQSHTMILLLRSKPQNCPTKLLWENNFGNFIMHQIRVHGNISDIITSHKHALYSKFENRFIRLLKVFLFSNFSIHSATRNKMLCFCILWCNKLARRRHFFFWIFCQWKWTGVIQKCNRHRTSLTYHYSSLYPFW